MVESREIKTVKLQIGMVKKVKIENPKITVRILETVEII